MEVGAGGGGGVESWTCCDSVGRGNRVGGWVTKKCVCHEFQWFVVLAVVAVMWVVVANVVVATSLDLYALLILVRGW